MTEDFNDWWNGEVEQAHNPYQRSSAAYWAWLGWMAGAAHEREACARLCDAYVDRIEKMRDAEYQPELAGRQAGAMRCAAAIRARGNT